MYTYLLLNIVTISFPLSRSFEPKINFSKKWKFLLPAIFITGFFFIIWDHYFTKWQIWSFNEDYLIGIYLFSLPIEEWLFFITVPFACVFIYEVLQYFISNDPLQPFVHLITFSLIIFLAAIALANQEKLYTSVCFSLTATALTLHWFFYKKKYLGKFYLTYLVHLVPFIIIDGLLTYLPVVRYNDTENLGIKLLSIPVEDMVYSFLLLLINITLYEFFKKNKHFT